MVKRISNPGDRRSSLIQLTENGAEITAELNVQILTANQAFLASLGREEEIMSRGLLQRQFTDMNYWMLIAFFNQPAFPPGGIG